MARNIASRVVSCVLCGMMALSLSMGASAESITEASTEAENAGGLTQAESGDYALQKNDFKIGLSNSFYNKITLNTINKKKVIDYFESKLYNN